MWTAKDDQQSDAPGRTSTNSEVVLVDGQGLAPASTPPTIANLNVTKSSRVHIGPKFVSVTQNLHNTNEVKGRFLGLELVSPKGSRRLRCSVAVFVCWAFLVASGLVIYVVSVALPRPQGRLDIGLKVPWYLRRGDWQAMPPYSIDFLELPLSYVIIGHSAANFCEKRYECIEQMLVIQQDHLRRGLSDIGPNFLVGGKGFVFEGRGANVFGAMVTSWNVRSITIMFMGNYVTDFPNQEQFDHLNILLDVLVRERILVPDYTLYAQCQLQPATVAPGRHVLALMDNFANWNSFNRSGCLDS
ncbi:PREDICTED: peptidoglycan-recognition protein SC2-like isoform X2 [Papilio polytes]|uniref:peptidoglycan-recognition protein SC2-like isoform X2 n=1 Tax=Papilio polytes TaxID=76194 RepID=UPI0006762A55|nr:PREDICTED: peptidoglycan-recognition protein SC2-like isoform X2 [Papilio polytes]